MNLFTIGFTKSTARSFFSRLRAAGVRRVIDTRLHADGQLSGFAKAIDLEFFLSELIDCRYVPEPLLAPTDDILKSFKAKALTWDDYVSKYRALLVEREIATSLRLVDLEDACLLCSEHIADHCHRRVAAEFIRDAFQHAAAIEIVHL